MNRRTFLLTTAMAMATRPAIAADRQTIVVLGVGQSNMHRGGDGHSAGIGQQFVRRLQAKYPSHRVVYVQVSKGGQPVSEFMPGKHLFRRMVQQAKELPAVDYLLIHQGEGDRGKPHKYWARSWNTILRELRKRGVTDRKTVVLMGEMARNGPGSHQNGAIRMVKGAVKVSSKGLPLEDRLHFTRDGLNAFGDRYFAAAMKVRGQG